jgi:hypothetical protein
MKWVAECCCMISGDCMLLSYYSSLPASQGYVLNDFHQNACAIRVHATGGQSSVCSVRLHTACSARRWESDLIRD